MSEALTRVGPEVTFRLVRQPVHWTPLPSIVAIREYDCRACWDVGTLGIDPETSERIYCHECLKGINLHLQALSDALSNDGEWIERAEARMKLGRTVDGETYAATCAHFEQTRTEYDQLERRWESKRLDALEFEPY